MSMASRLGPYDDASVKPTMNAARNGSVADRSPSPMRSASVGAVIGSIATTARPGGVKSCRCV